jgi:trigger factor
MHVQTKQLSDTKIQMTLTADAELLEASHKLVVQKLGATVKVQGFRPGKAPLNLLEKSIDPARLQSEFLDEAVNRLYSSAVTQNKLRPVDRPSIEIKKFVPFTTLEVVADVDIVGAITLPDYKKMKLGKKPVKITAADITDVIANLSTRMADKKDVARAAKDGDQVVIDFFGTDAKSGEPINGGEVKAYPLILGSNTFIPGFEPNLIGIKAGDEKSFEITFPKDYSLAALQGKKVIFAVTLHSVQELISPVIDDAFAAKVGPFKTLAELKANIKVQVTAEREQQAARDYESDLLEKLSAAATVNIPDAIINQELERLEQEERRNVIYRGQTWQEHLDSEGVTDEEHKVRNRPGAAQRVRAGLVLSEIAEAEGVAVTNDEIDVQVQLLKGQYNDEKMRAELDKPENRRDIASRILTEKTIAILVGYATAK